MPANEPSSHYFAEQPAVGHAPQQIWFHLPERSFSLETDTGVFSSDAVDTGTAILLKDVSPDTLPPYENSATLVDLGCGYGPIALTLAARNPAATVYAVDINERARQLCERNAGTNQLTNVKVIAPHQWDPTMRIDQLWSNPPIRIGKPQLHALLLEWLHRLSDTGYAMLVVQKHLGADSLATWLESQGFFVKKVLARKAFRLLQVQTHTPANKETS